MGGVAVAPKDEAGRMGWAELEPRGRSLGAFPNFPDRLGRFRGMSEGRSSVGLRVDPRVRPEDDDLGI